MTISRKVGLHVLNSTGLALGRPAACKLVDPSLDTYRRVRAEVGADCLIVVRWYHAEQPLDNPARNASDWFNAHREWMQAIPDPDRTAFEGWNEIGDSQAPQYAAFETARLALLHSIGRRACVGNWSVGCPDLPVWMAYDQMLRAMHSTDVVGTHEYWSDRADLENVWHVRRFTLPVVAAHLQGKQIVVTECGRDYTPDTGKGKPGWMLTCSADEYLGDLRRLGELYDGCANVIGATVFQTGSVDPKFAAFNMYGVWPTVVTEYVTQVVMPTPPEDTMIPYYYSSRDGYPITDIVIHDTEGPAQAALNWWKDPGNTGRSSAHVLVTSKGEVIRCVPDYLSAHHAGYATIPGRPNVNPNRFSLGIELEYPKAPASPPWPDVQLKVAAGVVRGWCDTYAITEAHIWEHKTIDPTRRSDPRNWDRAAFLARVWPQAVVPVAYLPSTDRMTLDAIASGDPAQMQPKARFWVEEATRKCQDEDFERALAILHDVVRLDGGLMYELERALS